MPKGSQTHQKRQRENKVREKAKLKRELRQQRQADKKQALVDGVPPSDLMGTAEDLEAIELGPEFAIPGEFGVEAGEAEQNSAAWPPAQEAPAARPPQRGMTGSKLFVGNLPHSVTEDELADFVFQAGCAVASAQVIRDRMTGAPKGFAFVELGEGTDVQQAIGALDGQMLQGRRLTVNEARPQGQGSSGSRGGFSSGGAGNGGFRNRSY